MLSLEMKCVNLRSGKRLDRETEGQREREGEREREREREKR